MSESSRNNRSNPQQIYTSFDQFIAQNDFSQLNNNNYNPYSRSGGAAAAPYYPAAGSNTNQQQYYYQPSTNDQYPTPYQYYPDHQNAYTLTADASEFVPRSTATGSPSTNQLPNNGCYNQPVAVTVIKDHQPIPLANLSLTDTSDSATGSRPETNLFSSGAVPKQTSSRNNRNNTRQPPENRRQQQQSKNHRPDRRKYEHDDEYTHWNGSSSRENGYDGYPNNRQPPAATEGRNYSHNQQNRSNRNNNTHESSSIVTSQSQVFRNTGGRGDKRPVTVESNKRVAKPTDYQPNRNLKRPERQLEHPVDISQREKQIVEIDAGYLECLVCCETIKPTTGTWNCKNCYHILHLSCTTKWATRSKSDDGWRCPACQNLTLKIPYDYMCFCSKQKNPIYNRSDVAHSCGDVCERQTNCSHPCTLLCHPGACPTCQASVTRNCGCGATTKTMICSQEEAITCDGLCDKMRNCGLHRCAKKCHTGTCDPCDEKLEHDCYCGRETKTVACTAENLEAMKFSCPSPCEKELDCKNHKCLRLCHPEECRPCDLKPDRIKSCPCGKRPVLASERKTCLDEIPLCEAVCNKILSCGAPSSPHRCISKCHLGACPPCQKSTAVKCRCGQMDQMVKCKQLTTRADDARCKKKCTKKRSCGKHKCNMECCIEIDHICPLPCPSTLSCGKHKCERTCHPGHCLQCHRMSFHELQCECGAQVIYPPVPCGTKKPTCDKPCTRSHACSHSVLHNCHTAAVCPPCMLQTAKFCYGNHEQRRTIPCSQESFSCGMPCNKELSCGEHKCIKTCHEGECMAAGEVCRQSCVKTRAICGHKCMAPCHQDSDCPETMCKETVEVVCQCGVRKQNRVCHDFANEFKRVATAQLASSLQVSDERGCKLGITILM